MTSWSAQGEGGAPDGRQEQAGAHTGRHGLRRGEEEKVKYSVEKERRKLEGDLKMCQGSVSDMEKDKREMEQSGGRTRNHEWKMTLI